VDKLLHRENYMVLPTSSSDIDLAETFADYFIEKIATIQKGFNASSDVLQIPVQNCEFSEFQPLLPENVEAIIRSSPSRSCCLDSVPMWLLKVHLQLLLPSIVNIVNMSLSSIFPLLFKKSIVIPLLKKLPLNSEILKHYRPVSNLAFLFEAS